MKRWNDEDMIAYGYRKWRWLANHMVTDHVRELALRNRRITARETRLRVMSVKRSKKNAA